MTDALVTDAHVRSSVWFIRALLQAGVPVTALGPTPAAAGRWARGLAGRAVGPDAHADPLGYVDAVASCVRAHGTLVVYPGQEESIDALVHAAGALPEGAVLPYPPVAVLNRVRDKRQLSGLAATAGLRTPVTLYEGPVRDLPDDLPGGWAVLKPLHKGGALARARAVATPAHLQAALDGVPGGDEIVLQEAAEGPLAALCLVLDRDGGLAARFEQRTLRTWPADAGPSRVAVSVEPDEALAGRTAAMLAAAGFWGLAEVQFMGTAEGPAVIDVNPRPYGSLSLALAAGVNLPAAWHAVATGGRPPGPHPYRAGVTYRWLEAEVHAALHGDVRSLAWRAPRPAVGAMWAADDPVPSALLAGQAVGGWLARQAGRLTRGAGAGAPVRAALPSSGPSSPSAPAARPAPPAEEAGRPEARG